MNLINCTRTAWNFTFICNDTDRRNVAVIIRETNCLVRRFGAEDEPSYLIITIASRCIDYNERIRNRLLEILLGYFEKSFGYFHLNKSSSWIHLINKDLFNIFGENITDY